MMRNNAKITGMLIRKYRLEQNMSQESLCQGICAVSYLSKIEKGTVLCRDEILSKLFDVLGISVPDHSQSLEIYEEKIYDYFRHFFFSNNDEMEIIMEELRSNRDALLHSYLAIDMMIAEAYDTYLHYDGKTDLKSQLLELLQYEDYMNDLQAYCTYILIGMFHSNLVPYITITLFGSLSVSAGVINNIGVTSMMQKEIPLGIMGRVTSVKQIISTGTIPLGQMILGIAFDKVASYIPLMISGVIIIVAAAMFNYSINKDVVLEKNKLLLNNE